MFSLVVGAAAGVPCLALVSKGFRIVRKLHTATM